MKAYLASHCPFQGEGKKRIALLIPVAVVGSRRQYFFSNFQWQSFFPNIGAVCWHPVKLGGPTHCLCSVPSIPSWRSTGRQRRESSLPRTLHILQGKHSSMLIATKAALRRTFCPQFHQKGLSEQGLTEQEENQDHPSQTELLAAIFFLLLMALSYCHTWNQVKSMLILLCKAVSLSLYNKSGALANFLGRLQKSTIPYFKCTNFQPRSSVFPFNFDCLILR